MTFSPAYQANTINMRPDSDNDWDQLVGSWVEVHHEGEFVRAGIVDEVMSDRGILWLASSGVEPRTLFDKDSGYRIRVEPVLLQSKWPEAALRLAGCGSLS